MFLQGARKEHIVKKDKTTRPAPQTQMTLILEEELHLANRIRAKLPSLFPLLFCGRPLSIYLNGDSQAPTVWVRLRSALYHQQPRFTDCGLGFSRCRHEKHF